MAPEPDSVREFRLPRAHREAAMKVSDIQAAKGGKAGDGVIGIEPTASLAAAAKLLSKHRIGAVVIRGAGGRLAGILSERDIVRAMADAGAEALTRPVAQVMTREVVTCTEHDTCAEIVGRGAARGGRRRPGRRGGARSGRI